MSTTFAYLIFLISVAYAQDDQDPCTLEPEPGPCRANIPRYFFNPETKSCETFIYGGCQGVVPFETLRRCVRTCDPCRQKPDAGPCNGRLKRFFFHRRRGTCEPFIWGGCDGTVPFDDLQSCETQNCVPEERPSSPPKPLKPRCSLEPESGPCLKNKTRWYWDDASQMCKSFKHSGCFGRVPFRRKGQCIRANCGASDGDDANGDGDGGGVDIVPDDDDMDVDGDMGGDDKPDVTDVPSVDKPDDSGSGDGSGRNDAMCRATPDPGPCRGNFPRWFYNPDTDSCESFIYGGCQGSAPFATRTECEASSCIQNRCTLEPERGPCDGNITRYFYNQGTGKCDSFSHGGCFGLIPFKTLETCTDSRCETKTNNCGLLPEAGPCDQNVTRYWYDTSRGECATFQWGGCDGVVPFETKRQCENAGCVRDVCKLVPDSGFCRAFFRRYFWNQEFRRCEGFTWGGCGGVVPFETEMECEEALCAGADFGNNNDDDLSRI